MDGDQNNPAPVNGRHYNPADIPPSLTEPSQLPQPVRPVPLDLPQTTVLDPALPSLPVPQDPTPVAGATNTSPAQAVAASLPMQTEGQMTGPSIPDSPTQDTPAGGFYHPDTAARPALSTDGVGIKANQSERTTDETVSWVSSGDALQSRSASWRVKMTLVALVFGVIVFIITRDLVSAGAVAFAGLLFGILGARKPPALQYHIDRRGIMIGQRYHGFGEFRAFSIVNDQSSPTVNLVPLKRFAPLLSLHLDYQQHDQIINILSNHLPMEAHKRDAMDLIINKVKF